jgi:hypothetical protein
MKNFNKIKAIRNITNVGLRNLSVQRMVNLLPKWAAARKNKDSNFQQVLNIAANPLVDVESSIEQSFLNTNLSTCEIHNSSFVYEYRIPMLFEFTRNETGEYEPIGVMGLFESESIELENVAYNKDFNFINEIPFKAIYSPATFLPFETVEVTGENVDNMKVFIPVDNYLYITITSDTPTSASYNGNYYLSSINFNRVENWKDVDYTINPVGTGVYQSNTSIAAGFWTLHTDLFPTNTSITIDYGGFDSNFMVENQLIFNEMSAGQLILKLSTDGNYLEYLIPVEGGVVGRIEATAEPYSLQESAALLDEFGDIVTIESIAKADNSCFLYGLENREGIKILHVYSYWLNNENFLKDNSSNPPIDLRFDTFDYKVGDTVILETRKLAAFMDSKIKALRLSAFHMETNITTYYNFRGQAFVEGDKELAWEELNLKYEEWYEQKWPVEIEQVGLYVFKLEIETLENFEKVSTVAAERSLAVYYHLPLASLSLGPIPVDKISVIQGVLYGLSSDNSTLGTIELVNKGYIIDYENYRIYTATKFDSLELG